MQLTESRKQPKVSQMHPRGTSKKRKLFQHVTVFSPLKVDCRLIIKQKLLRNTLQVR